MSPDMADRHRLPELMDQPGLEPDKHVQALRALARVNRVSGVAARVWGEVVSLHRAKGAGRRDGPIRFLDVACGGGDVIRDICRRAQAAGLRVEADGCDVSPVALAHARRESERRGVDARFFELDVVAQSLPTGYDLVCSSLFHHHLLWEDALASLSGMAGAGRSVMVQDLLRGTLGYMLAWSGLRVLSRSDVARMDGPRSVRAAFTLEEARALAKEAGLEGASVRRVWPERFILRWRRP